MIMRNILFSLILIIAFSCGESKTEVTGADKYIETITGFTGYDTLASQFLEEAKKEGVSGLKGVLIVDIKNSKFEQGAVVGKRIGKAYE